MSRLTYDSSTAIGQIIAEGINALIEGEYKIHRAAEAVGMMDETEAKAEVGIDNLAGFRSSLNQISEVMAADPLRKLLPNLDQG